ncbi:MAG: hypothetical protein ACM3XS_09420 [Bacteroidota bacterium]
MKRRIAAHFLLPWLSLAVMVPVMAVSPASEAGDMLFKSGLSYTPLEGRSDTWYLTYTGLNNLDEIVVYVWVRKTEYITLFTTVFSIEGEPAKDFLWRLLELNDSMLAMKYVIREDPDNRGFYLVDCQVDLPLNNLTAVELREAIEGLVAAVDENFPELDELL